MLLGQYQQFQSCTDSLKAWMQACEASVEKLLSDTVASDPGVLQQQLATTKVGRDVGCSTRWVEYPQNKANTHKGSGWDALDQIWFLNT